MIWSEGLILDIRLVEDEARQDGDDDYASDEDADGSEDAEVEIGLGLWAGMVVIVGLGEDGEAESEESNSESDGDDENGYRDQAQGAERVGDETIHEALGFFVQRGDRPYRRNHKGE